MAAGNPRQDLNNGRLPRLDKLSYSIGHILNDLCAHGWFSYLLIFMNKVIGLTDSQAGLVLLIGQVADAIFTPFIGYGCDKTDIEFYGKRKFWHALGTMCVVVSFPFVFNKCINCEDASAVVQVTYYSVLVILFQFGWAAAQISHLSFVHVISRTKSDIVELNALRSGMSFASGVFVFVLAWLLLGTSTGDSLNAEASIEFMYLSIIVCITGLVFAVFFHIGVKEPTTKKDGAIDCRRPCLQSCSSVSNDGHADIACILPREENESIAKEVESHSPVEGAVRPTTKKWKDWLRQKEFYSNGIVFMLTRLGVNVFQSFFAIYLTQTLRFNKEAIAYFPLLVLIAGGLASCFIKTITGLLGTKAAFLIGSSMVLMSSLWLLITPASHRQSVYGAACLAGGGFSLTLVIALAMTADLIGDDEGSTGFVYAAMSFTDKLATGVTIAVIQSMKQHLSNSGGNGSETFSRLVQSVIPGCCSLLAALVVLFFYPSRSLHTKAGKNIDECAKVNEISAPSESKNNEEVTRQLLHSEADPCESDEKKQRILSVESTLSSYAAFRLSMPLIPSPMVSRRVLGYPSIQKDQTDC